MGFVREEGRALVLFRAWSLVQRWHMSSDLLWDLREWLILFDGWVFSGFCGTLLQDVGIGGVDTSARTYIESFVDGFHSAW